MKPLIAPFVIGLLMSGGFVLGGVTKPETIINFLDVAGNWQGDVMGVMGAAVVVTFLMFRLIFAKRQQPVLEAKFLIPTRRDIDWRLIVGASVFGLGWGLIGFCPGPALATLATGSAELYVWFAGLLLGMYAFRAFDRVLQNRSIRRQQSKSADPTASASG